MKTINIIASISESTHGKWFAALVFSLLAITFILRPYPAHAQCATPAGVEGEIIHNDTHNVPAYCNGTNWIGMVGARPECPNGLTSCGGQLTERLVFTTSTQTDGNTGGVSGADNTCNTLANAAGLSGTYYAWLTDSNAANEPATRFEQSDVPYVLVNGTTIANNWTDLTDGNLNNSIGRNELNGIIPNDTTQYTYTNTNTNGTQASATDNCSNFTTGGSSTTGGSAVSTSNWTSPTSLACNTQRHIYCFEQASATTQIVPDGLIGHWRLDETSGTTAADSSGNGNDGTLSGMTLPGQSGDGVIDTGFTFPYNSSLVRVTHGGQIDNLDQMTISLWIYRTTNGGGSQGRLIEMPGSFLFRLWPDSLGFSAQRWDGTDGSWRSGDPLPLNQWYHYAVSYDYSSTANTPNVYVNGQPYTLTVAESSPSGSAASVASDLILGNNDVAGLGIDGNTLDDVRIYDRILTPEEITEIYNARDGIRYNDAHRTMEFFNGNQFVSMTPSWPEPSRGLVGHWKLDETDGTTAFDSSGNGNDGTMQNGLNASSDTVTGSINNALDFKPISSVTNINIGNPTELDLSPNNELTISAWLKYRGIGGDLSHTIFSKGYFNNSNMSYGFRIYSGGQLAFQIRDTGGTIRNSFDTGAIPLNQWVHAAVTWDGTTVRYYTDAVLGTQDAFSYTLGDAGTITLIGAATAVEAGFDGAIDDVRIYDRALSTTEITQLYSMGTPAGSLTALPQGCPNIGDVCDDGTIYVGSIDGEDVFTTPEDTATSLPWNNGNSSGYVQISTTDTANGEDNTSLLVVSDSDTVTAGFQTHQEAQHCYDLVAHGADDWFLPDAGVLSEMCNNQNAIGGFTATWYNSSSEAPSTDRVGSRDFSNCGSGDSFKNANMLVRCARQGPAPRCANPYGLEGEMIYNSTSNVVQYCDGARWIAIGKDN